MLAMGVLTHCWWDCKLVQLIWKLAWRFLTKPKIDLPYDPVVPLQGTYAKASRTYQRCLHIHVYCCSIHRKWSQLSCPSADGEDTQWHFIELERKMKLGNLHGMSLSEKHCTNEVTQDLQKGKQSMPSFTWRC